MREDLEVKQKLLLEKMEDIGQLPKKHMRQVDDCLRKLDETTTRVQKLRTEIDQYKQELDRLQQKETAYAPTIFSAQQEYKDYTNAVYDPEQTITRIVDFHIMNAAVDEFSVTINGQRFDKKDIDCLMLNLHSRTDMCPFCAMFIAHQSQAWRKQLRDIPFVTIVTSRQEYRCDFFFITQKPYYQGYSMRSLGWRKTGEGTVDRGLDCETLKAISNEGLVIQHAFQPWEIYCE